SRAVTSRAFSIVRSLQSCAMRSRRSESSRSLADLLDERDAARELVVHEGPSLVLDLVQLRDLQGRQDFAEARLVRRQYRDVIALDGQELLDEGRCLLVGHRLVRLGVGVEEFQDRKS